MRAAALFPTFPAAGGLRHARSPSGDDRLSENFTSSTGGHLARNVLEVEKKQCDGNDNARRAGKSPRFWRGFLSEFLTGVTSTATLKMAMVAVT